MSIVRTDLSKLMHALADDGHDRATELREKANAFDVTTDGIFAEPQTHSPRQLLGTWARARRVYSECSGKSLL